MLFVGFVLNMDSSSRDFAFYFLLQWSFCWRSKEKKVYGRGVPHAERRMITIARSGELKRKTKEL